MNGGEQSRLTRPRRGPISATGSATAAGFRRDVMVMTVLVAARFPISVRGRVGRAPGLRAVEERRFRHSCRYGTGRLAGGERRVGLGLL